MTPLSDGEVAILAKLADVAQQQAVTTERLIGVLERLNLHMERADEMRDKDVASMKAHVTETMAKTDGWWRRWAIIGFCLLMAGIVVDAALTKFLPFFKP